MNIPDVLALYDQEQRRDIEYPDARREVAYAYHTRNRSCREQELHMLLTA